MLSLMCCSGRLHLTETVIVLMHRTMVCTSRSQHPARFQVAGRPDAPRNAHRYHGGDRTARVSTLDNFFKPQNVTV